MRRRTRHSVDRMDYYNDRHILDTLRWLYKVNKTTRVILLYLERYHQVFISERTLRRICAHQGIKRYDATVSVEQLAEAIQKELNGCRKECGYRRITLRLRLQHGLLVKRKQVYDVMTLLDHQNVRLRQARAFRGRKYYSQGPNWIWHVDQYDKLSHYGFHIHACIDGFSRKILWSKVYVSNSNPWVIAKYYYEAVSASNVYPQRVRVDRGTENTVIAACQVYLRRNHKDEFAGGKSIIFGKSKLNQRIEAWWSSFRRSDSNFWINYFKEMEASGIWSGENPIHRLCLLYVYMPILQTDLADFTREYNAYRIRKQKDRLCPQGVPDDNYTFPEVHGYEDKGIRICEEDMAVIYRENGLDVPLPPYIAENFRILADEFVLRYSLITLPVQCLREAKQLYLNLTRYFENVLTQ